MHGGGLDLVTKGGSCSCCINRNGLVQIAIAILIAIGMTRLQNSSVNKIDWSIANNITLNFVMLTRDVKEDAGAQILSRG